MSGAARWLYVPVTVLVALGAGFVLASGGLRLMAVPAPVPEVPQIAVPVADLQEAPVVQPAGWPALFGTPPPPAPPAPPPKAEPAPPAPQVLVVSYVLKGLIAGSSDGWAILGGASGDQLVRVGDTAAGGEVVTAITAQGVDLEKGGLTARVTFVPADASVDPSGGTGPQVGGADGTGGDTGGDTGDDTGPGVSAAPDVPAGPLVVARPLPAMTLRLSEFKGERLARIITRAGGVAETQLKDGSTALEILWVRNGLLYDRISLKQGDKIKSINGRPIVEAQNSVEIIQALVQARSFELELIRNGALRSLRIEVQDAD